MTRAQSHADRRYQDAMSKLRQQASGGDKQQRQFKLTPFRDIGISTAPAYLVKGIIPRHGLVIVWGAPKCGKSFWTFDLAMHVACGWNYRGHKVQQGLVIYLALEGGTGFHARVEAWRRTHLNGDTGDIPFYLLDVPIDMVADCTALIATIQAELGSIAPTMIVVDTLNRALTGDENKSDDMAKFIRAIDIVRAAFGCTVLIVHHCGTQGSRPRGHTSLSGADDAQIAIERSEAGIITATVEHMKDGEAGLKTANRLESVDLGTDEEGDPITSCVCQPAPDSPKAQAKAQAKTTANQKRFLDILKTAIVEAPADIKDTTLVPANTPAVARDMLKKYCVMRGWMEEAESNKARAKFSDMLNTLAGKNLIGVSNAHVWLNQ